MKTLVVIPARGGSKGIPHKNIKPLNGKPLICYSIDIARQIVCDEDICVTTDDDEIIKVVEDYGLHVPFKRPAELATDTCGSNEVIQHAYTFYENQGLHYDIILLLQPTSPFRQVDDVKACVSKYSPNKDMVVSVKPASANPYYDIYEEDEHGNLIISKGDGTIVRRQEAPKCYEYNGAVYVINPRSLMTIGMPNFKKVGFVEMDEIHSLDLDTILDWKYAELLIKDNLI